LRRNLLGGAVMIFGIVLGADPSPMGTVKDTVVLLARSRMVFPPRLIALGVFILMGVVANRFICSWGCQAGVLQDLVFRFNRDRDDTRGLVRQYKIPFAVGNGIRVAFFVALFAAAFGWALDIAAPVDPFGIFRPATLAPLGWGALAVVLAASLFVWRPWCHLFCPFGLVAWLTERFSILRIGVNRRTCVSCGKCDEACPTTVMAAIRKRKKTIPDCYACGTCINACPTKSIRFGK
jgi:polyferredoxin